MHGFLCSKNMTLSFSSCYKLFWNGEASIISGTFIMTILGCCRETTILSVKKRKRKCEHITHVYVLCRYLIYENVGHHAYELYNLIVLRTIIFLDWKNVMWTHVLVKLHQEIYLLVNVIMAVLHTWTYQEVEQILVR